MNRNHSSAYILTLGLILGMTGGTGCASKVLKVENSESILNTQDVDTSVQIKEIEVSSAPSGEYVKLPGVAPVAGAFPVSSTPAAGGPAETKTKTTKTPKAAAAAATKEVLAPAPVAANSEAASGRRPAIDPFRAGEKVTLEVSYFSVVAGDMTIETRGFAEVNGRKSYRFAGVAHSTSVFAMFYAIDDWFETFVDYETLVPQSYSL
ncbi:MAG: DUF3108 domain-containing protein, partial [Proteobacteria bacterium]